MEYTKEESKALVYRLVNGDKLSFPEYIKDYIYMFQNVYFKNCTKYFNQMINFLMKHYKELNQIDTHYLSILLEKSLARLTIPTDRIFKELEIVLGEDNNRKMIELDREYYESMIVIFNSFEGDGLYFDAFLPINRLYSYYLVFKKTYNEFCLSKEYELYSHNYDSMFSYDSHMVSRYIIAYAYYYNQDTIIIDEFIKKYVQNYSLIKDFIVLNNIDTIKNFDFLVNYTLYLDTNDERKVIL